jgi:hypothetical protein
MANFDRYTVGLHNVGSYQVSGVPYITGSTIGANKEHTIKFPMVAKSVTVIASGSITNMMQVAFNSSSAGSVTAGNHYIDLDSEDSVVTFNVKCKQIFIKSYGADNGYRIIAELTSIPTGTMPDSYLTGSGLTTLNDSLWSEYGF